MILLSQNRDNLTSQKDYVYFTVHVSWAVTLILYRYGIQRAYPNSFPAASPALARKSNTHSMNEFVHADDSAEGQKGKRTNNLCSSFTLWWACDGFDHSGYDRS